MGLAEGFHLQLPVRARSTFIDALEVRTCFSGPGEPEILPALPASPTDPVITASQPLASVSSVPAYNSNASAFAKIYLEFRGAPAQNWGNWNVTQTPAYDLDGDASTFSQTEFDAIHEIWSRVSEKYSPFNINVTTVDPGVYNYHETVRVVIGGDGAWTGAVYGGYAFPDGFIGSTSNTAFVFAKNLGQGRAKYVAESVAHEAGHTFGLQHQAAYDSNGVQTNGYRGGRDPLNPNLADPVMGFSYYAARGVWASGPTLSYYTQQDDMAVIGRAYNGFGVRADDHPNAPSALNVLNVPDNMNASASGIIETTSDIDYFMFHSDGGMVSLRANVAALGPTLDLAFALFDSTGQQLASADTVSLGESINYYVNPGDYYVAVSSHGAYGDVGTYTVTGTVVPEPASMGIVVVLGIAGLLQRRSGRHSRDGIEEKNSLL